MAAFQPISQEQPLGEMISLKPFNGDMNKVLATTCLL
jgi:hypothetical protein